MAPLRSVACFGAAHVDVIARASSVVLGTSNPVSTVRRFGGVARNVAVNLARRSMDVRLVSLVGGDAAGDDIVASLAEAGVDAAGVMRHPERPTASYKALIDGDGELVVGLADMGIYDDLTPDRLKPVAAEAGSTALWFAEANLPAPTLAFLAEARGTAGLAADAVSVAKAPRLSPILSEIDFLFCNRGEAAAMLGSHASAPAAELGQGLLTAGARAVIVTEGPAGVTVADRRGIERLPAPAIEARDVTGAGDALIAGTLAAWIDGRDLIAAVRKGLDDVAETLNRVGA
jgi:pseudouridine kinase